MQRARLTVLGHYSGGYIRCGCCGQNEPRFLALDHVGGGGATHRKDIGAGDKQDQPDSAEQHEKHCAAVADNCFLHRDDQGPPTAVGFRELTR